MNIFIKLTISIYLAFFPLLLGNESNHVGTHGHSSMHSDDPIMFEMMSIIFDHKMSISKCKEFFSKHQNNGIEQKLFSLINANMQDSSTSSPLNSDGVRVVEITAQYLGHQEPVRTFLTELAFKLEQEIRWKNNRYAIGNDSFYDAIDIMFTSLAKNPHPDTLASMITIWNKIRHAKDIRKIFYRSLGRRYNSNFGDRDQILDIYHFLYKNETSEEMLRRLNDYPAMIDAIKLRDQTYHPPESNIILEFNDEIDEEKPIEINLTKNIKRESNSTLPVVYIILSAFFFIISFYRYIFKRNSKVIL